MAGGKKPLNIFKLSLRDDPKEVNNIRLWIAVISFGLMGIAAGIDSGLITAVFNTKSFQALLKLGDLDEKAYANVEGNITSMVLIGSVGGSLICFLIGDKIGRLWIVRQLCITWIIGIAIFLTNNGRLGQVYAGRFIAGLAVGEATVIAPVYLCEIAPKGIRGLCLCCFSGSVYLGVLVAYFADYGTNLHIDPNSYNAWAVPSSLHIVFAGLFLILTFVNFESPRYLLRKGQTEAALKVLTRLRNLPQDHPAIVQEVYEITHQFQEEQEATMGAGWFGYLKEMFLIPENLYRIYLGVAAQILAQWSGGGSITIYAPDIFAILGKTGKTEQLLATCIFGVVKFISSLICGFFLIDVVGRKRALAIGIALQAVSMIYVAAFLSAVPNIAVSGFVPTHSQKTASVFAIFFIYISGFGWAMGWNSIQYLLTSEIYPLRIRAMSAAVVTGVHYVNQYGNSRAVPSMLLSHSKGGLGSAGTFWLFAAITILGLVWSMFTIPETAGISLEDMDDLFRLKWYQIGLKGSKAAKEAREARQDQVLHDLSEVIPQKQSGHMQVETVSQP